MHAPPRQQVVGRLAVAPRAVGRASSAVLGAASVLLVLLFLPTFIDGYWRPNQWAWSELHINYAAGFVRRGLLGELGLRLQTLTGTSTPDLFGTAFVVCTLLEIALLMGLLRPLRTRPLLLLLVALSPGLVLFAAYDPGAYMRKDLFFCLGLLGHAWAVQAARFGRLSARAYRRVLWCAVAPYLAFATLVHEVQLLLLGAHVLLVVLATPGRLGAIARNAAALLPALGLGLLSLAHHGNAQMAARICASWAGRTQLYCGAWSGIEAVGWPLSRTAELSRVIVNWAPALWLWLLAAALTLVPIVLLRAALGRRAGRRLPWGVSALLLPLPLLPLFALGWDWGRWIHLLAMAEVSVLLAGAPRALEPARPHPAWLKGALALCAALYVGSWHLPHSGAPATLEGGFVARLPRLVAFFE